MAILIWMAIYPTITLVLWASGPLLGPLPLPLRTLALTVVVVPFMVFIALPLLTKVFSRWLFKRS